MYNQYFRCRHSCIFVVIFRSVAFCESLYGNAYRHCESPVLFVSVHWRGFRSVAH